MSSPDFPAPSFPGSSFFAPSFSSSGFFITFEGGEGAGKTTQIQILAQRLRAQGYEVLCTREPGGVPLAEDLRNMLLNNAAKGDPLVEALLFAAARRAHCEQKIRPALAQGHVVLCDRFIDSTRAYQGGRLQDQEIETLIGMATNGLAPQLTFLFDLLPEIGLARVRNRGGEIDAFEASDLAFHQGLRQRYLNLAAREPKRIQVLDASLAAASLAEQVFANTQARFLNTPPKLLNIALKKE